MQDWPFWVILGDFGGKRLEKLQIRRNWPFGVILSHFSGKRLEKLQIRRNWPFQVILSQFSGKRLEKLQIGQNWPFWTTLVGKDWKSSKSSKIQLFFGGGGTSVNSNLTLDKTNSYLIGGGYIRPTMSCWPKIPAEFEKQRFSFQCIPETRDVCIQGRGRG